MKRVYVNLNYALKPPMAHTVLRNILQYNSWKTHLNEQELTKPCTHLHVLQISRPRIFSEGFSTFSRTVIIFALSRVPAGHKDISKHNLLKQY